MNRDWTASVLIIGDEILFGCTQDKNIGQIATWRNVQGICQMEVRVVADIERATISAAANAYSMSSARRSAAP